MSLLLGVDDSKINRAIIEAAGELLEVDVVTAENGKEAWDIIQKGPIPMIIVTDIIMPEMDGLSFLKLLKQNKTTKYIPVLLFTTENNFEMKNQGRELGASGWIEKPASPEKLSKIIKKFIQN